MDAYQRHYWTSMANSAACIRVLEGLSALKQQGLLACVTNKPIASPPAAAAKGLTAISRWSTAAIRCRAKTRSPAVAEVCADFGLPPRRWWPSATRRMTRKPHGLRVARC
jgi:hypothetical protein